MINVAIWLFYVLVALFTLFGPVHANGSTIDTLNKAIEQQKNSEVTKAIEAKSFDPGVADIEGITPLMTAAINGNVTAIKLLLDKNANLEQKNKFGDTALALAVSNDQDAAAKLLINAGAKVDVPVLSEHGDNLLITAAKSSEKTTRLILLKNKSIINQTNNLGNTALMESIRAGYTSISKLLIQTGADVTVKNVEGKTALDIAKETKSKQLIVILNKKSQAANATAK